jgi:hypothetical protein
MKNSHWVNRLFSSFEYNDNVKLFFENKEKLKENYTLLNLSIHPIRFAVDIFFNFETNDEELRKKLKNYEVNYDVFYHYADIVKATYLKTVKRNNIKKTLFCL